MTPNVKSWHEDEMVKLKISNTKMDHEGTYTCTATNSAGSAEISAFVTVEGKFKSLPYKKGFNRVQENCYEYVLKCKFDEIC